MSHALWFVALIGGFVAELTLTAINGRGTFNSGTSLLLTFVWGIWIWEETFAVGVVTAFNLFAVSISAEFLWTAMIFGSTFNWNTLVRITSFLFAAIIVTHAVNFDTSVWFFTVDEVGTIDVFFIGTFTSTNFTVGTVSIVTTGDWDTLEFFTSASAFLTFWSGIIVTHIVTDTVNFDTCVSCSRFLVGVTDETTFGVTVLVGSAFKNFTCVFDTLAFTSGTILGVDFT